MFKAFLASFLGAINNSLMRVSAIELVSQAFDAVCEFWTIYMMERQYGCQRLDNDKRILSAIKGRKKI
jgi:hypothetical protein